MKKKEKYIELETSEEAKKAGLKRIKRKHFVIKEKEEVILADCKKEPKKELNPKTSK